ncbi:MULTISPECIES: OmpA family protein [unclassified Pseudoalteromonas]|uniref:OmpA family protein n=1 Tax=unclassified Pseudoalteromonas TaxID=194690 RepID=UPI0003F63D76|nr:MULTISPECIES: OmpA family protein [unclassified Pseudoalteromonas]
MKNILILATTAGLFLNGCTTVTEQTDWESSSRLTHTAPESYFIKTEDDAQANRNINRNLELTRKEQIEFALDAAMSDKVYPLLMEQPRNKTIYFPFSTYEVADKWDALLTEHVNYLLSDVSIRVLVAGFTDEKGSAKFNLNLGLKRANNVCRKLTELGVRYEQVTCVSYGESHPADPGTSPDARARNRRVEFLY